MAHLRYTDSVTKNERKRVLLGKLAPAMVT